MEISSIVFALSTIYTITLIPSLKRFITDLLSLCNYPLREEALNQLDKKIKGKKIILCTNKDHKHSLNTIQLGSNLKNIQTNLYSSFRELDNLNLEFGIFEEVTDEKEGSAIMDRVKKASFQIL